MFHYSDVSLISRVPITMSRGVGQPRRGVRRYGIVHGAAYYPGRKWNAALTKWSLPSASATARIRAVGVETARRPLCPCVRFGSQTAGRTGGCGFRGDGLLDALRRSPVRPVSKGSEQMREAGTWSSGHCHPAGARPFGAIRLYYPSPPSAIGRRFDILLCTPPLGPGMCRGSGTPQMETEGPV